MPPFLSASSFVLPLDYCSGAFSIEDGSRKRSCSPTLDQCQITELEELVERLQTEMCLITTLVEAQQRDFNILLEQFTCHPGESEGGHEVPTENPSRRSRADHSN